MVNIANFLSIGKQETTGLGRQPSFSDVHFLSLYKSFPYNSQVKYSFGYLASDHSWLQLSDIRQRRYRDNEIAFFGKLLEYEYQHQKHNELQSDIYKFQELVSIDIASGLLAPNIITASGYNLWDDIKKKKVIANQAYNIEATGRISLYLGDYYDLPNAFIALNIKPLQIIETLIAAGRALLPGGKTLLAEEKLIFGHHGEAEHREKDFENKTEENTHENNDEGNNNTSADNPEGVVVSPMQDFAHVPESNPVNDFVPNIFYSIDHHVAAPENLTRALALYHDPELTGFTPVEFSAPSKALIVVPTVNNNEFWLQLVRAPEVKPIYKEAFTVNYHVAKPEDLTRALTVYDDSHLKGFTPVEFSAPSKALIVVPTVNNHEFWLQLAAAPEAKPSYKEAFAVNYHVAAPEDLTRALVVYHDPALTGFTPTQFSAPSKALIVVPTVNNNEFWLQLAAAPEAKPIYKEAFAVNYQFVASEDLTRALTLYRDPALTGFTPVEFSAPSKALIVVPTVNNKEFWLQLAAAPEAKPIYKEAFTVNYHVAVPEDLTRALVVYHDQALTGFTPVEFRVPSKALIVVPTVNNNEFWLQLAAAPEAKPSYKEAFTVNYHVAALIAIIQEFKNHSNWSIPDAVSIVTYPGDDPGPGPGSGAVLAETYNIQALVSVANLIGTLRTISALVRTDDGNDARADIRQNPDSEEPRQATEDSVAQEVIEPVEADVANVQVEILVSAAGQEHHEPTADQNEFGEADVQPVSLASFVNSEDDSDYLDTRSNHESENEGDEQVERPESAAGQVCSDSDTDQSGSHKKRGSYAASDSSAESNNDDGDDRYYSDSDIASHCESEDEGDPHVNDGVQPPAVTRQDAESPVSEATDPGSPQGQVADPAAESGSVESAASEQRGVVRGDADAQAPIAHAFAYEEESNTQQLVSAATVNIAVESGNAESAANEQRGMVRGDAAAQAHIAHAYAHEEESDTQQLVSVAAVSIAVESGNAESVASGQRGVVGSLVPSGTADQAQTAHAAVTSEQSYIVERSAQSARPTNRQNPQEDTQAEPWPQLRPVVRDDRVPSASAGIDIDLTHVEPLARPTFGVNQNRIYNQTRAGFRHVSARQSSQIDTQVTVEEGYADIYEPMSVVMSYVVHSPANTEMIVRHHGPVSGHALIYGPIVPEASDLDIRVEDELRHPDNISENVQEQTDDSQREMVRGDAEAQADLDDSFGGDESNDLLNMSTFSAVSEVARGAAGDNGENEEVLSLDDSFRLELPENGDSPDDRRPGRVLVDDELEDIAPIETESDVQPSALVPADHTVESESAEIRFEINPDGGVIIYPEPSPEQMDLPVLHVRRLSEGGSSGIREGDLRRDYGGELGKLLRTVRENMALGEVEDGSYRELGEIIAATQNDLASADSARRMQAEETVRELTEFMISVMLNKLNNLEQEVRENKALGEEEAEYTDLHRMINETREALASDNPARRMLAEEMARELAAIMRDALAASPRHEVQEAPRDITPLVVMQESQEPARPPQVRVLESQTEEQNSDPQVVVAIAANSASGVEVSISHAPLIRLSVTRSGEDHNPISASRGDEQGADTDAASAPEMPQPPVLPGGLVGAALLLGTFLGAGSPALDKHL